MAVLECRPLGHTGEKISVIGLGGGYLANVSLSAGVATVRKALELGVSYFDTSPAYGNGASQVILGEALSGRTEPYMLATKLGHLPTPGGYRSTERLWDQLLDNLRLLRRNNVDVLQVHEADWERWWRDDVPDNQLLSPTESYRFADAPVMHVLREARAQGLCHFTGVTANNAEALAHVLDHVQVDLCLLAYKHNVLFRQGRQLVLPLARKKGMGYIAAGVLMHVINATAERPTLPPSWITPDVQSGMARLYELGRDHRLSMVSLAIRYMVADPDISTILVGAATPEELEESVMAAMDGPLPPDLHQAVEELGLP